MNIPGAVGTINGVMFSLLISFAACALLTDENSNPILVRFFRPNKYHCSKPQLTFLFLSSFMAIILYFGYMEMNPQEEAGFLGVLKIYAMMLFLFILGMIWIHFDQLKKSAQIELIAPFVKWWRHVRGWDDSIKKD